MSDFRAISGVSGTLRGLLLDRMELPDGVALDDLNVTIGLPYGENLPGSTPAPEQPRINLFLYQVSQNATLANKDMPGRGHPAAYGFPPLSLNLHYLVTAYGSTAEDPSPFPDESQAQLLLGSAMRVLHDHAIITRNLLTVRAPVGRSILQPSLRDAFENLKICLDPVSIEDLTKIWTALTIPYRLSAAYSVSVIQIESRRTRRYPQLVGELPNAGPRIHVIPLQTPYIQALTVRRQGEPQDVEHSMPYVHVGDTLIISGQNLMGGSVIVTLGDLELPVTPVSAQRIEIEVPDDVYGFGTRTITIAPANRLQPGAHPVEVRVAPAQLPQAAVASNQAVMMLTPHVMQITSTPPRLVRIEGTRLFAADLESQTLVGQALFDAGSYESATPTILQLTLPDSAPYRTVSVFLSAPLGAFPALTTPPQLEVTIGAETRTVQLGATPTSFAESAAALQEEMRNITGAGVGFRQVRVGATENRFVIVPGGLTATVAIADVSGTSDATTLGLQTLTARSGYLSGALMPFTRLTTPPGAVSISLGALTRTATLEEEPTSLEEAAQRLQAAINNAGVTSAFVNALVLLMDGQLLVVPGSNVTVNMAAVAGVDETTVAELQLRRLYPVRVRVNGVEGIGGVNRIELPL